MLILPGSQKGGNEMEEDKRLSELLAENEALKKQLARQEMELTICKTMIEISENLKDPYVKKKIEEELSKRLVEKEEKPMEADTESESYAGITE